MFLRLNNLNEGAFQKNRGESKIETHSEGKNPKTDFAVNLEQSWQSLKKNTHVNLNWEKLRK